MSAPSRYLSSSWLSTRGVWPWLSKVDYSPAGYEERCCRCCQQSRDLCCADTGEEEFTTTSLHVWPKIQVLRPWDCIYYCFWSSFYHATCTQLSCTCAILGPSWLIGECAPPYCAGEEEFAITSLQVWREIQFFWPRWESIREQREMSLILVTWRRRVVCVIPSSPRNVKVLEESVTPINFKATTSKTLLGFTLEESSWSRCGW